MALKYTLSVEINAEILECKACGRHYLLREDGLLEEMGDSREIFRIPDWYEWERETEIKETADEAEAFSMSYRVHVEALPNEKGFVDLGKGKLLMNEKEFTLDINKEVLHFQHKIRESVQTEYDYRGKKGKAIVLSTAKCCYYIYCDDEEFNPTQLQFIGEWLFQKNEGLNDR